MAFGPGGAHTAGGTLNAAPPAIGGGRRLLLIGGTSEIGLAIARRLAQERSLTIDLLGRDREGMEASRGQLEAAGCRPGEIVVLDADALEQHDPVIRSTFAAAGGFDVVVLAVGVLGAQAGIDSDPAQARRVMRVNFDGAGSLLLSSLRALRESGGGALVVLSSVAVERPRAANAVYGAAKAGLDALAQGLADATLSSNVRMLVVRPGFVHTKMTANLEAAPFATTPDAVADATASALARGAHTVWVPGILRIVFAVLRHLPRPIYRRLPL